MAPKTSKALEIKTNLTKPSRYDYVFQTDKGDKNDEVREEQAVEMRNFINQQNIAASDPVIVTGDFNIDFHTQVRDRSTHSRSQ